MKLFNISLLVFLLSGIVAAQATAQEAGAESRDVPIIPADDLDRGTPMRSAQALVAVLDAGDYEKAAEYLDLRNLRGEADELNGTQLARRFSVIINRATWVDVDELVDDPAGRSNDNLPDYRDSIGVVLDEGKEVRLLLQRVPRGDGIFIWKISNATVSLIPALYDTYGYPKSVESLRRGLPDVSFLGFELFKWVIVLSSGFAVYVLVFLLALAIRRTLGDPHTDSHKRIFRFLVVPFGIWLVILSVNAIATSLGRGATAERLQQLSPVPILVTMWVMFGGMNLLRDIYVNRLHRLQKSGAAVLVNPATNAVKLLIVVGASLVYLDNLGFNITTVLAGLGVGGIAVALALQKPMEDVFGAITLYTQQPIRVGDFCRVGTETGTIEEIGLRTTRLRTLADTVIAIPNARLSTEPIDNISARKKILFRPRLRLRYDTTPEQLNEVLDGLRELLASHGSVLQDAHRVRFREISTDALLIEIFAYLDTIVWTAYLELVEELNMKILEVIERAGTSLSLPAQTLRLEQVGDGGKPAPK